MKMTKSRLGISGLLLCAALGMQAQSGTQSQGPRDLYNTYGKAPTTTASPAGSPASGQPGVRVRVELDRGGKARWVSPRTVFRAGDRVRFHFAMNFTGYVAIINLGSSGKRTLLFPEPGMNNRIGRTADYTVPQGEGWFEFDNTPGIEELTFVMSKQEIPEVAAVNGAPANPALSSSVPQPVAPPAAVPPTAVAPVPAPALAQPQMAANPPKTEEDEILEALNARSLTQGRDLKVVEQETDGYVLSSEEALAKPVGFKLRLQHR
jgi:hypothetical protein